MRQEAHWTKPVPGYDARVPIWKRFVAFLIDILVFDLIVAMPLSRLTPITFGASSPMILAIGTILVTLFFGYLIVSQYLMGQTVGMLFMRYRVKNHEQLWRCVLRNIFILPIFPFFVLWVIEPIHLVFTGDRLTERWTKTTCEVVT